VHANKLTAFIFGSIFSVIVASGLLLKMEPAAAQADADSDQQFAPRGADTCLTCHSDPVVTSVLETPHGNSAIAGSPFAQQDCESCHGASPTHVRGLQSPAVVFTGSDRYEASDADVQNQICLGCHQSTETVHWAASIHQAADLTCVSCHTIHASQATALSKLQDVDTCLSCHLEKRSQLNRRSHHPIREGLMSCNDCHNPHGSDAVAMLAKSTINDTCATCHAEKRGPFLWEHQPVSEECTTCHNPHGSTQASMLTVRQPFLCQSCHSEAYHPSFLYSGDDIPPTGAGQSVLGTSCTNCHSSIHGSNHPSGSRLTR
jgi:DmsE family decaheme c-type cytochrome